MKINIKVFIYNFENYNLEDTTSPELVENMPFVEEVLILSFHRKNTPSYKRSESGGWISLWLTYCF